MYTPLTTFWIFSLYGGYFSGCTRRIMRFSEVAVKQLTCTLFLYAQNKKWAWIQLQAISISRPNFTPSCITKLIRIHSLTSMQHQSPAFSRRSGHTERNVELKPTVLFRTNSTHFEIVITWCYRKFFYIVFHHAKSKSNLISIMNILNW